MKVLERERDLSGKRNIYINIIYINEVVKDKIFNIRCIIK